MTGSHHFIFLNYCWYPANIFLYYFLINFACSSTELPIVLVCIYFPIIFPNMPQTKQLKQFWNPLQLSATMSPLDSRSRKTPVSLMKVRARGYSFSMLQILYFYDNLNIDKIILWMRFDKLHPLQEGEYARAAKICCWVSPLEPYFIPVASISTKLLGGQSSPDFL